MPRLILLCGLPASGKSTYAETFMKTAADHTLLLSSDALIEALAAEEGLSYQEAYGLYAARAQEEVLSMADYAVAEGIDVVWDQTNLTPAQRAERAAPFFDADYEVIAVAFEAPQHVLKARFEGRAAATGKTIPTDAMAKLAASYKRPDENEGFDHVILITPDGARTLF